MKWIRYILLSLTLLTCNIMAHSEMPAWEVIDTASASTADPDRLDVQVRGGYIYVYTPEKATVKVLSIVGQLISQQTLPPGVSRLKISARGIYILKVGDVTKRVTI